ncbi:MAG TPA: type IV pilus assembly protein PilM [Candidatus Hydrogenedens sp.]|nr:type IV pilus assembly protein PilM [Candidatus Hydrogenedens sp.]
MSVYTTRKGKKRVVIEIGTSAVRLCEFKKTKSGLQLIKYFEKPVANDYRMDEEERKDLRKKAVAELLKQAKVKTRKLMLAVPGQSVFVRVRSLPPVSERKVDQIVRYEIQQQIPFDLKQIAIDYQILDHPEGGGYEVLMVAIKTDVVDKYLSIVEGLRLSPDIVDVIPFASYSWLKYNGELHAHSECVAVIDLGASTTNIVVERDGIFRNTRTLNIGGNDITQAIADAFNIPFDEAEKIKCEKGFAPTGNPQIDGKGGEAIGRVLNRLVNEIQRSFSYFRSLPGGGQVTRVYLCGGGCALRNIVPFLQRALGIDVRIAQPLSGITIGPDAQSIAQHPERSCVVLGLALRNWETAALEINLIPPRIIEIRRRKEQAIYWALSMITLALIMASVIPVHAAQNKFVKERIEELRKYVRMYDPEVAQNPTIVSPLKQELSKAQAEIKVLENKVNALDKAVYNRRYWLDEMSLVLSARPPRTDKDGVWFSSIETVFIQQPQAGQPMPARGNIPPAGMPVQQQQAPVNITGFPGIGSHGPMVGISGRGGGGLFRRDDNPTPAPATTQQPTGAQQAPPLPRSNGFRIMGLATSDTIIKTFVDNLKKASLNLPEGVLRIKEVYFSESSVQVTPWSSLYNAQSAFQGSSTLGMGSFGSQQRLGAFSQQTGQAAAFSATGQNLFTFIVTVQFERVSAKDLAAAGGGAGS